MAFSPWKETPIRSHRKKNKVHVYAILNNIEYVPYLGLFSCADKD